MEDASDDLDAVEERQWSRRGAVMRAMSEKRRSFTVRLDLDGGQAQPTTGDDHPPVS